VISSVAIGKSIYSQASKFQEIYQAESEVRKLAKENENLKTALEEQKSPLSLERDVRDKLGFQKPGDVLFVVPQKEDILTNGSKKNTKKNWEEWFELLFR